jgi:hypothetical protein
MNGPDTGTDRTSEIHIEVVWGEDDGASKAGPPASETDRITLPSTGDLVETDPVPFVSMNLSTEEKDRMAKEFIAPLALLQLNRDHTLDHLDQFRLRGIPPDAHLADVYRTVREQLGYNLVEAAMVAFFWKVANDPTVGTA